jgi:hypothetical protein
MRTAPGKKCTELATHHWGPVNFCCPHFSQFVEGMFDLSKAISVRRHEDLVSMYETATDQNSKLTDALCEEPKKSK